MLVRCKSCNKPVFISSSAVSGGQIQVTCKACKAELIVNADGDVAFAGGETVEIPPPSPAAAAVPAPEPAVPEPPALETPERGPPTLEPPTQLTPSPFADAGPAVSPAPVCEPTAAIPASPLPGAPAAERLEVIATTPGFAPFTPEPGAPSEPSSLPSAATQSGEGAPFAPSLDIPEPQGPVIEHNPTAEPTQVVESPFASEESPEVTAIVDPSEAETRVTAAPVAEHTQIVAPAELVAVAPDALVEPIPAAPEVGAPVAPGTSAPPETVPPAGPQTATPAAPEPAITTEQPIPPWAGPQTATPAGPEPAITTEQPIPPWAGPQTRTPAAPEPAITTEQPIPPWAGPQIGTPTGPEVAAEQTIPPLAEPETTPMAVAPPPVADSSQADTQITAPPSELAGFQAQQTPQPAFEAPTETSESAADTQVCAPGSPPGALDAAGTAGVTDPSAEAVAAADGPLESAFISKDQPLDGADTTVVEDPFDTPGDAAALEAAFAAEPAPPPVGGEDETQKPTDNTAIATFADDETGFEVDGVDLIPTREAAEVDEEKYFEDIAVEPRGRGHPVLIGLVVIVLLALVAGGLWAVGIVTIPGAPPPPLAYLITPSESPPADTRVGSDLAEPAAGGEELASGEPATAPAEAAAIEAAETPAPDTEPGVDASEATSPEPGEEAAGLVQDEPSEESPAAVAPAEPEERPRKRKRRKKKVSRTPKPVKTAKPAKPPKPVAAAKKPSADDYYRKADALMRQKKVPAAIEELKKAVAANPRHAKSYRLLGMAYWSLGKQKSAIVAFERFVKLDPRHKDVPKLKALIANQKKK